MGVTLERVQFKFASIIGELCNEPLVLSQFAVWLDLRLSEYKLKGSISLDCSGDVLLPKWLRGMQDAKMRADHKRRRPHLSPDMSCDTDLNQSRISTSVCQQFSRIPSRSENSFTCDDSQIVSDIIINEEGLHDSPENYPTSSQIYRNEFPVKGDRTSGTPENYSLSTNHTSVPTFSKQIRKTEPVADSSFKAEPLTNQSLMSIIGNISGTNIMVDDTVHVDSAENNDINLQGEFLGRRENSDMQIVETVPIHRNGPNLGHASGYYFSRNRGQLDHKRYKELADWIKAHYRFAEGQKTRSQDIYDSCCVRFSVSRTVIGKMINSVFPGIKTQPCNGIYFYYNLGPMTETSDDLIAESAEQMGYQGLYTHKLRTTWSSEERKAIKIHLLPMVQRMRKPPMKLDVERLQEEVPLLRSRHWSKIKHQTWSLFQQNNRKLAKVSAADNLNPTK